MRSEWGQDNRKCTDHDTHVAVYIWLFVTDISLYCGQIASLKLKLVLVAVNAFVLVKACALSRDSRSLRTGRSTVRPDDREMVINIIHVGYDIWDVSKTWLAVKEGLKYKNAGSKERPRI